MFRRIRSYCLFGIKAVPVSVEVDASQGLPGFTLVGLPDNAVRESRERVISAIRSIDKVVTGFRTTVNLSPADLRKEGSALDLPLAIGLLVATGEMEVPELEHLVIVGELSLDGLLKPVRGVLSIAMSLADKKNDILVIPRANEQEASLVEGIRYICADSLKECVDAIEAGAKAHAKWATGFKQQRLHSSLTADIPDFRNVIGMEGVKRALEIAAAGAHNFLLVGSPGAGKTLCAKCLPGILPEMTETEILETTRIHSCARAAADSEEFRPITTRPFRTPHHSASMVSLVGGGTRLKPGEASLAHNGVLFLDEASEFKGSVLQALRVPMETGRVTLSRAGRSTSYPCRFQLLVATNPCPCGNFGVPGKVCLCSARSVEQFWRKFSAPLLDRIDIRVPVVVPAEGGGGGTPTVELRPAIAQAVATQRRRQGKPNSQLLPEEIPEICNFTAAAQQVLGRAVQQEGFSPRAVTSCLKVARTIADMAGSPIIEEEFMIEAIQFRRNEGGMAICF